MNVSAQASGKIILFGEHAVVYGRPAIAVPVLQVNVRVTVEAATGGVTIESRQRGRPTPLGDLPDDDPLAAIISRALRALDIADSPNIKITIESTIPIASGLGSGAAVSTAIARALASYFGRALPAPQISAMVYEVEKIHHGTPSGIDNTVIAFEKPVYFVRPQGGEVIETFSVPVPFRLAIADTGIASPTKIAVGDVRRAWAADKAKYESLFDRCGAIARQARAFIERGQPGELGALMSENHKVLREMGVSSAELEALVSAALEGGAAGAKLSGAGRGGNMIALVTEVNEASVRESLLRAGAKRVITTQVGKSLS